MACLVELLRFFVQSCEEVGVIFELFLPEFVEVFLWFSHGE